eukprot:761094-Hanusia_phi.AAC.2
MLQMILMTQVGLLLPPCPPLPLPSYSLPAHSSSFPPTAPPFVTHSLSSLHSFPAARLPLLLLPSSNFHLVLPPAFPSPDLLAVGLRRV